MKYKIGQQVFIVERHSKLITDIIKSAVYNMDSDSWRYMMVRSGRCSPSYDESELFSREEDAKKALLEYIELEKVERPKRELALSTQNLLLDVSARNSFYSWLFDQGLVEDWLFRDPRN